MFARTRDKNDMKSGPPLNNGDISVQTRRTRLEILLSVLRAIKDGENKPTRIMYATNMSWIPTKKVLEKLVERGYIDVTEEPSGRRSKKRYEISEKGVKVLRYFNGAQELLYI